MKRKGHVIFYNIDWDTDGVKVNTLPKKVKAPLKEFDKDFDFAMQGLIIYLITLGIV